MSFFKKMLSNAGKMASEAINSANSFENVKDRAPNQIGIYLMSLNGKVMYVGRAIEDRPGQSTKGLRKRLQEHWRGAGNCKLELYNFRDKLTVSIKTCETVVEVKRLEGQLIRKYNTVEEGWNLRYED
jgi:excinuclease UvrABC nuclease subunit